MKKITIEGKELHRGFGFTILLITLIGMWWGVLDMRWESIASFILAWITVDIIGWICRKVRNRKK